MDDKTEIPTMKAKMKEFDCMRGRQKWKMRQRRRISGVQ